MKKVINILDIISIVVIAVCTYFIFTSRGKGDVDIIKYSYSVQDTAQGRTAKQMQRKLEALLNNTDYVTKVEVSSIDGYTPETFSGKMETLIRYDFDYFSFKFEENAVCVFEGKGDVGADKINAYRFALYKETADKDIVFVNMIYVEADTLNVYTWEDWENSEDLIQLGTLSEAEIKDARVRSRTNYYSLKYKDIDIDEMLNFVFASLKDKYEDLSIIYDGTTEFIDRYYYMISSFEAHEDHIVTDERYYFDMENGNLYRLDGWLFSRGELHYIANYSEYIQSMGASYSGIKLLGSRAHNCLICRGTDEAV